MEKASRGSTQRQDPTSTFDELSFRNWKKHKEEGRKYFPFFGRKLDNFRLYFKEFPCTPFRREYFRKKQTRIVLESITCFSAAVNLTSWTEGDVITYNRTFASPDLQLSGEKQLNIKAHGTVEMSRNVPDPRHRKTRKIYSEKNAPTPINPVIIILRHYK